MKKMSDRTERMFRDACSIYAEHGVDVEQALRRLDTCVIGLHAWQGDDVTGFENTGHALTGGCQVTGNYPGRARTSEELRQDLEEAFSMIPGICKVVLQGHEVDRMGPGRDRDGFTIENFSGWADWAEARGTGLDLAPAFYSPPKLDHGLSLSHPDHNIRDFWIRHGKACRKIAQEFARRTGIRSVCNFWAPDGFKDTPADRLAPRKRLMESLDEIFADPVDESLVLDAVESKLFGIGTESCTVGSHDFYLTYAARRNKAVCLDMGHFHPTESIADKLSAILVQQGRILLHVSRGVRWDSDHVIALNDDLLNLGREIAACGTERIEIGLDYFDATINRVGAWVIGTHNMRKALLRGFLEPVTAISEAERQWDFTARLALQEEAKTLPWNAVWNYYCEQHDIPDTDAILERIRMYEKQVQFQRG